MKFRLTNVGFPRLNYRGGTRRPINVTSDMSAATITTRYENIGPTNILSLAHYPMTVVMYEYE